MPPQIFHIQNFEAGVFRGMNDVVQVNKLTAWKNGARNEQALGVALYRRGTRDPVIQKQAVGSKQLRNGAKILFQVSAADVLEHADGRNLIEYAGDIAIVHFADDCILSETFFPNPLR